MRRRRESTGNDCRQTLTESDAVFDYHRDEQPVRKYGRERNTSHRSDHFFPSFRRAREIRPCQLCI